MAKISGKYETIFIVNPKLEEAAATAVVDKFKSLVEANGTNVEVEDWGKRRLAYPIEDQTEGVYTLVRFPEGAGPCSADHGRHHAFHHRLPGRLRR